MNLAAVFFPAVNNANTVIYSAIKSNASDNNDYLNSSAGASVSISTSLIQLQEMESNNGTIVYRGGNSGSSGIVKVNSSLTGPISIASPASFSAGPEPRHLRGRQYDRVLRG